MTRRPNPVVGYHPDLYESDETPAFVRLEDLSPDERADLRPGDLTDHEWATAPEGLREELWDRDETEREARLEAVKEWGKVLEKSGEWKGDEADLEQEAESIEEEAYLVDESIEERVKEGIKAATAFLGNRERRPALDPDDIQLGSTYHGSSDFFGRLALRFVVVNADREAEAAKKLRSLFHKWGRDNLKGQADANRGGPRTDYYELAQSLADDESEAQVFWSGEVALDDDLAEHPVLGLLVATSEDEVEEWAEELDKCVGTDEWVGGNVPTEDRLKRQLLRLRRRLRPGMSNEAEQVEAAAAFAKEPEREHEWSWIVTSQKSGVAWLQYAPADVVQQVKDAVEDWGPPWVVPDMSDYP